MDKGARSETVDMLIVLGYSHKDTAQALSLLRWMAELDGVQKKHELLLVASAVLREKVLKEVADTARRAFATVTTIQPTKSIETGWPGACNHLFRTAATYVARAGKWDYWQWIEPDCIPLVQGAFDKTEAAYIQHGKPFMGYTVHDPVDHLPGNALYPADIKQFNPFIMQVMRKGIKEMAWDCIKPELTLRHTANSNLFQHVWVQQDTEHPQTFKDAKSLKLLRRDAVFFHRNKDHSLILRLREQRNGTAKPSGLIERVKEWIKPVETEVLPALPPWPANMGETKSVVPDPVPVLDVEPSIKPPIYTYHETLFGFPDQQPLIDLWCKLWTAQGWKPIVLGEKDAKKGRIYAKLLNAIQKLPTYNHRGYENACYMRHLAMANRGGGLLTDYDVMPVDFSPGYASVNYRLMLLEPTRVPCAVMGAAVGYADVVNMFLNYQLNPATDTHQGKPHISDMEILRKSDLPRTDYCIEYLRSGLRKPNDPGDGWRQAKMIHFSSASMGLRGVDVSEKVRVIQEVLGELRTKAEIKLLQPA